jgi:peptidyl-prolyl cis-trans isomerase SurA
MRSTLKLPIRFATLLSLWCVLVPSPAFAQTPAPATRSADYILAVVNSELVTASELDLRLRQVRANAQRAGQTLPPEQDLRRDVLQSLIDERIVVTYARDSGQKVDDGEIDRAMINVAAQNQLTMPQLRERLRREGIDYARFRNNLRDQLLIERTREREVQGRIRISDTEVEDLVRKQRESIASGPEYNIAQVLVTIPEGATDAVVAERRARAEAALLRIQRGEAFDAVARDVSEDGNRARGGEIGMRPADRLPDLFIEAVRPLKPGDVTPQLVRSSAGFHILKLLDKVDGGVVMVTQTRVRHILLRPSAQLTQEAAARRLLEFKRQIAAGTRSFEQLARANSEDGSAGQGGDLGWASPGMFVPEFEEAMNALALNGISDPVVSRFGVHLIQVLERRKVALDPRQERDQARAQLREQKFDAAYEEWLRDLRSRAYVEMREPPQ